MNHDYLSLSCSPSPLIFAPGAGFTGHIILVALFLMVSCLLDLWVSCWQLDGRASVHTVISFSATPAVCLVSCPCVCEGERECKIGF